jgi:hypothetical protein
VLAGTELRIRETLRENCSFLVDGVTSLRCDLAIVAAPVGLSIIATFAHDKERDNDCPKN